MVIKNNILNGSYWTYPYLAYVFEPKYVYAFKCVLFIYIYKYDT